MIKADLHLHSSYSDGKFSPKELVIKAKESDLSVISITDHDSVDALSEAMDASLQNDIQVIPGIEFSASLDGREVHIIAYFIDYENVSFLNFVSYLREMRFKRLNEMIKQLNHLGCNIKLESVTDGYPDNIAFGRPHLATALYKEGFVKSYREAFSKYIGDNKPANVQKTNPPAKDIIDLISKHGGLSFVAHPGKYFSESFISELIELGIDGIEVIHPSHSKEDVKYFSDIASEYFLLTSGGSDFHGINGNDFNNLGNYYVSNVEIENMKRRLF